VIADAERAVALAGVMGGANSEVGAATAELLIESAHFDPARVRRAAKRHGLNRSALLTEAARRMMAEAKDDHAA